MLIDKRKRNSIFLLFILFLPVSWASISIGSIYRLITIVLFALFIISSQFIIRIPSEKKKLFHTWEIYVFYSVVSVLWGGFTSHQLTIAFGMILLYLISIVFVGSNVNEQNSYKIDYAWLIAGAFFVFLFLTGRRVTIGWGTRQSLVIMGTVTDANEFASFFAIVLSIVTILMFRSTKKIYKVLLIVFALSGVYVVLMSGSRGALLATIVAVLVTLLVGNRLTLRSVLVILVLGILFVFVFNAYLIELIPKDTLARISIEAITKDNGSGRSYIWKSAFRKFFDGNVFNILFGYGYGGINVPNGYGSMTSTMHNQFLQNLIAYGIIGFCLYIRLIWIVFCEYLKVKREYIGCLLGVLIMGLTITMGPSYKLLWIIFMIPMISFHDVDLRKEK